MNQPSQNLNISLDQTTSVECEECGNESFVNSLILRKVSGLLTGTGYPSYIPIPAFSCIKCNHINKEFLPKEVASL